MDINVALIIVAALAAAGLSIKQHYNTRESEAKAEALNQKLIESQEKNLKYALGDGYGAIRVWENQKDELFKISFYSMSEYPMFDPAVYLCTKEDLKSIIVEEQNDTIYIQHQEYNNINKLIYQNNVIKANNVVDLDFKIKKPDNITCLIFNIDFRHAHYVQLTMLINEGVHNNGIIETSRIYQVKGNEWILIEDVGVTQEDSLWKEHFYIGKIIHSID